MAFRRDDCAARGPLDERFRFYRNLDIWWSLVLRDEGEGTAPRRAVARRRLPADRHEHRGWTSLPEAERDRLSKRNFYRIIDRFGWRRDLLVGGDEGPGLTRPPDQPSRSTAGPCGASSGPSGVSMTSQPSVSSSARSASARAQSRRVAGGGARSRRVP